MTRLNSIESIRNYVRLTPRHGTAGQPERKQFDAIAQAGFSSVINIAMPDHADSIDDEGRLVTERGMSYFHLPVPFDSPQISDLQRFARILRIQGEQPVFVHCIMNYRVSAFMYHYLKAVEGYSEAQARSPILRQWQIEPQWQAIMALDSEALNL